MEDISPKLLEAVRTGFRESIREDAQLQKIAERIEEGTATYRDAQRFAGKLGNTLAAEIRNTLGTDALPYGTLYQNIAEKVLIPMLEEDHELVAKATVLIQEQLNRKAGIGLKALLPEFNQDKAQGLAQNLSNNGADAGIIQQQIENFSRCVVDDTLKKNLELHRKVGMCPKITRVRTGSKKCAYCDGLVYSGDYEGPGMPDEIFHRHRDCRCILAYDPGNGKKEDHWSKKRIDSERDLRIQKAKELMEEAVR